VFAHFNSRSGCEGPDDSVLMLFCRPQSALTLRSLSDGRTLLDCGVTGDTRERDPFGEPTLRLLPPDTINRRPRVVMRFEALGFTAPPAAWTILRAVGLVGGLLLLRPARRRSTQPQRAHPYRALTSREGTDEGDRELAALRRSAALAFAVHASAPLVLLPCVRAALG